MKKTFNLVMVLLLLSYYFLVPFHVYAESKTVNAPETSQTELPKNLTTETSHTSATQSVSTESNSELVEEPEQKQLEPSLWFFKNKERDKKQELDFSNEDKIMIRLEQKDLTKAEVKLPEGFEVVPSENQKKYNLISLEAATRKVTFTWNDEKEFFLELKVKDASYQEKLKFIGFNQDEKIIEEELTIKGTAKEEPATPPVKQKEPTTSTESKPAEKQTTKTTTQQSQVQKLSVQQVAAANKLNIDLSYKPKMPTVASGDDAIFLFEFKVTGSVAKYEQVTLKIKLPTVGRLNQNLNELTIAGVTPALDNSKKELVYYFETLKTGQTYKNFLKIQTENGTTLNGTSLKSEASLTVPGLDVVTKTAQLSIEASTPFAMDKVYVATYSQMNDTKPKETPPAKGDYSIWKISANVGKSSTGTVFLKQGSKIIIKDTLPAALEFISASDGGTIDRSGRIITWTFDAPTIAQQKTFSDSLFSKELTVKTRFSNNGSNAYTIENKVSGQIVDYGNQTLTQDASASINISQGDGNVVVSNGTVYYSAHRGPLDGKGNLGSLDKLNLVPTVFDTDVLRFMVPFTYASAGYDKPDANKVEKYNGWWWQGTDSYNATQASRVANQGFEQVDVFYSIDPKLRLETFTTGVPRDNAFTTRDVDLPRLPNATYSLKFRNKADFEPAVTIDYSKAKLVSTSPKQASITFTRADLNLSDDQDVSEIKVTYSNGAPRTTMIPAVDALFSIKAGARGTVSNSTIHEIKTRDGSRYRISEINNKSALGSRQATIASPPDQTVPVATTTVELQDQENGVIQPGANRLKVTMKNDGSSLKRLTGPLTSYVLLPEGVKLANNVNPEYQYGDGINLNVGADTKITDDYLGTGSQLVQVKWNVKDLNANQSVAAFLNVDISDGAPLPVNLKVYSYSQDSTLRVPSNASPGIRDTYLDNNNDQMSPNHSSSHQRIRSGNRYTMVQKSDIQTEKLVKGQLDNDFSKFGHTLPGGKIEYQLKLTNVSETKVSRLTLMDVLPSVGDLGITDNVQRESKFTPVLTGPIALPSQWQNNMDIYYSRATNPERDDLTANVDYPEGTEKLTNPANAQKPNWLPSQQVTNWEEIHSFKVVMKKNVALVSGKDITLNFSMRAPKESEITDPKLLDRNIPQENRAAWNSFALAVNEMQAVEPARVGVSLELEKPTIHKDVAGQNHLDLKNRHESFTWNVKTFYGNSTSLWQTAEITDQINPLLDIEKIEVVDSNNQNVLANGKLTQANNLVKFVLNKQNNSFSYLVGQTYTLKITTKIRKDATASQLEPFIKNNGIPNQATLKFGDEPKEIQSETPTVTPPDITPLPNTGGPGKTLYLVAGGLLAVMGLFYFRPLTRRGGGLG